MKKTTIAQNRNLVDYAEYYDLVYGTENKNTELNNSLRKKVLQSLFELHSEDFPNNRRAVKEVILHGQEIRDYSETQYVVKDRFEFAQRLYSKFISEVVEEDGNYIANNSGYEFNSGAILNSPEQSQGIVRQGAHEQSESCFLFQANYHHRTSGPFTHGRPAYW